ncbi:hypothetical protein OYC64_004759 [Pagothenia borchgrevinki]|uniref:Ubiquitin-like protease family profile domain-containing protein n=1 Tax=Pagothenia borchgrevinki TaxID=8213 RepID=A0ABD2GDZ9_PAGBO
MAHNRSFLFEALDRSETRRDGGYRHNNWSFSLSGEEGRIQDSGAVSIEEMNRQQPEETKAPSLRRVPAPDPLRTYENRTNSLMGPLSRLPPKRLSDVPEETSSSTPNRTNFCLQGIVLQGRHFQHAQMPSGGRRPGQSLDLKERNDFSTTPQGVEVDSIVLTCPEISDEDQLSVKRRVQQQKRKPLEDFCSFPSQVKAAEPLCPTVYHTVCMKCKKPSEDVSMCVTCGNGAALLSTVTPRPPLRSSSGQISLQQSFYRPASTLRSSRGSLLPLSNSNGLSAGGSGYQGARNPPKGKRAAAAHRHELNDPIVLSSDEEEEADNASTGSVSRLDSVSPRPADSAHSSPAPSGGRVEAAVKSAGEEEEINADFFEDVNMKITIPRRSRMKDQFGNQPPEQFSPRTKKPKLSPDTCDSIILECRSVRIGTLRRMVTKPVVFSIDQIQLETEGPECNAVENVYFRASELISCEWCKIRKLPVLFFQTTADECFRLRSQLNMNEEKTGEWYDCAGDQSDEKFIVLIFENGLVSKEQNFLDEILREIGRKNNLSDFPSDLPFEEANIRLVNYNKASKQKEDKEKPLQTSQGSPVTNVTPLSPVAMATRTRMSTRQHSSYFEDEEEEMTDLQHTFSGPIIKLMVYPPPPAKGGISVTNEDLHCLNEGEFLNDVILDFYLKYLVLERLKKEDAQRIHIFSSFFYKRLNQRERRNAPETSNLPIHKRKHNRVKTWTRHVDLFQKDFIFVPINESAHWYLAVICFPGLNSPLFDQNPQNPQSPASSSALQSEESVPDSVSPDRPDPPSEPLSVPQASREGATEGDPAPPPTEPQYTSELHRISVSYASAKEDSDPFSFSDDQSSCQDECSEDGTLPEDPLSSESASKLNVCRQPCILIMDSLRGPARSTVVKTLREYLEVEWEVRQGSSRCFGKEVMKGSSPRVPQQDNFSDCGVYVLQYVESFFESPIPSFHLPVNLSDWFPQQRMKTKREEIRQLILKIKERQEVDRKEVSASPRCPEVPETPQTPNVPISP